MQVDLEQHYRTLFQQHGDSPKSAQYRDRATQEKRFEVLSGIGPMDGATVLDFGCGTAHLANYFKQRGMSVGYVGVDLVQEMLDFAARAHPEHRFLRPDDDAIDSLAPDWVLISGVFNNLVDDNRAFYQTTLTRYFALARRGLAFNMMSRYVDYLDPGLFYESPEEAFRFAKTALSPYVTLRNDYQVREGVMPFEFTVYVYRR